jgi:hypothetical protein
VVLLGVALAFGSYLAKENSPDLLQKHEIHSRVLPSWISSLHIGTGPGMYAQILNGTGLRSASAADAMVVYLLMGYATVHSIQDDKTVIPTLAQSVREQGILASSSKLRPDYPVAATRLGKEMELQGFWQSALQHKQLATYQQRTAQLFKTSSGLDLGALRLTVQGFAKR